MPRTKLLIFGYSSFARRRLIPSLKKIKSIQYYICSGSHQINPQKRILFNNYKHSLKQISPNIVYISLINSLHYKYAKMVLKKGFNVIVDKPITCSLKQTKELLRLARKKKILLAEATVFNYHRVFDKIINLCGGKNKIHHIQSNFNFFHAKSIKKLRINKEDCEMDMGPYAASIIRLFTNGKIKKLKVFKEYFKNLESVKSFFIISKFDSCTYFGNFGVNGEYISQITFFTKNKIINSPNRIFALPSNQNSRIVIKQNNKTTKMMIKKDDCIQNFLREIIYALKKKKFNLFYNKIIYDATIREKIRKS